MRVLRLIGFLISITQAFLGLGQQPSYIQFSVNNGLPSNNVYYSIQDHKGYFWFATDKGVARFNGYNFKVYTTNDGLSDNEVFDIYEDSKGRIWFSCYNGELCFYMDGKFYTRYNCAFLNTISRSNLGLKVLEDSEGTVYFVTQRSLISIQKNNVVKEQLTTDLKAYATLYKDEKGSVFSISYDTSWVYMNNLTKGTEIRFAHNKKEAMPRVNTKATVVNGKVYYSLDKKVVNESLTGGKYTLFHQFDYLVQFVKRQDEKNIWIGTQKGLYLFNTLSGELLKSIFTEASISSVNLDNEKHVWITTLDNGVYLLLNQDVNLYNQNSGMLFDYAANFFAIDSVRLMIGSRKYNYSVLTADGLINSKLPLNHGTGLIRNVRKDANGNLYVITAVSIVKMNSNLKITDTYTTAVKDLHFFSTDSVYVARTNGISKVDIKCFEREKSLDTYFFNNVKYKHPCNYFYKSPFSGEIYCVGNKGIKVIENGCLKDHETDSLFINNVTDLLYDPRGILYLASDINGVLAKYKGRSYRINLSSGLPSNFATGLTMDDKSNVWVSTAKGISKLNPIIQDDSLFFNVSSYNKLNGLIDNSINSITWHGNRLFAATNFGVCAFTETKLLKKIPPPVVNIETIFIGDSLYESDLNKEYISNYNQNNLRINYVSISSGSLDNITYVYRMKGLEEEWNSTRNVQLQYPSLPPGNYLFEIKALNARGDVSEIKSINIIITPAFYQTIWFKIVVIIGIGIIGYVIVIFRLKAWRRNHELKQSLLESENRRLQLERDEANMQMKLIELEQKALRLHMNPHFIFNAINAINGFYVSGEPETGKRYITKFSQLLRMLLDFSTQKTITIKQEVELLTNYFLLNQLRFKDKFDFEIDIDHQLNQDIVTIPPMIIQPFVENALIHGIAPLKTKGLIVVQIKREGEFLICSVTDNGVGRQKSGEINADKIHKSTGIKVTEERIKANLSSLKATNPIEISDLKENSGSDTGTRVVFKIVYSEMY